MESYQRDHRAITQIHLYSSDQEILSAKRQHCKSFEEILQEKVDSQDQIFEIYSSINERIETFKNSSRKSPNSNSEQINKYYLLKSKTFYHFYTDSVRHEQVKDRLNMFKIDNLYELFLDIVRIRDELKGSIYKLFGAQKRRIKINGYLLIFKVESLIKQIINAAYPFKLYSIQQDKLFITSSQSIQITEFKSFIDDQDKQLKKFHFNQLAPLKNSLLQLSDEIESLSIQIKRDEQALSKLDIRQTLLIENEINMVQKIILMNNLQYIKFQHECHLFQSFYLHSKISNSLDFFNKFLQRQPVLHLTTEKIEGLATQYKEKLQDFNYYFKYLRHLISLFSQLNAKQYKQHNRTAQKVITLIQNWMKIAEYHPKNLPIYENYVILLQVHHQNYPQYLQKRQDHISFFISGYIQRLIDYYIKKHEIVIERVIAFDEEFTYCLLTTNKIIQTILEFQDQFVALIDQFAPIIKNFVTISQIKLSERNKIVFIKKMIERANSLTQDTTNKQIQIKKDDVDFNIQIILSVCNESMEIIKPYLKQIQLILTLVKILKRSNIKRNINKMQKQQFQNLKKCAQYFSQQRQRCPIYQLKSKILLFITLFKMGYHNPTLREQQKLVNLRNRIINLYNRLYNHNISNMMLSRINSMSIRRSHSQQSYYIYDPLLTSTNSKQEERESRIQLQASQQLGQKINKFITLNFINTQNNSKLYLMNLLNLLQHELFLLQKAICQQNQNLLSQDYMAYLKICMDIDQDFVNPNIQIILNIERLFYLEYYEKAWNILSKQKIDNPEFNLFLEKVESSSTQNIQILKFLRLYNIFEKMNHIFYNDADKQKNINQLFQMINANTLFSISRSPIEIIYNIRLKENRLKQLQSFYNAKLKDKGPLNAQYEQIQSFLTKQTKSQLKVYQLQKINKTIIRIQIGQIFKDDFIRIHEQLQKYLLFNQIGIYKINDLKIGKNLLIELQSNPFILKNQDTNLFKSKILSFEESSLQKFTRKIIQFIVQTLHVFYQQNIDSLQEQQIYLTLDPLSFCINPFTGLIRRHIKKLDKKIKNSFQSIRAINRQMVEKKFKPFLNNFSPVFRQHYYYFIDCLSQRKKKSEFNYNKLLELPLFMTFQQKQVFIVYFDNKMSQMCDSFHQQLRKLRKEKKFNEAEKLRQAKMKDPVYKNYSYHFIVGGVIETEMIKLKICSNKQNKRLDWITDHEDLKISYDLPKKQNSSQIKEYAYSLDYFLKYLRGALAHKIENNYSIILNFSEEFPKIFDYLHQKRIYLEMKFQEVMNMKNEWLREYFNVNEKVLGKIRSITESNMTIEVNEDVQEAIQILKSHEQKYIKVIKELFKTPYKCDKCNQLIIISKKCPRLFQFLLTLQNNMIKKNHFLSVEHNYKDCFLSEHMKNHRVLEVFGRSKKAEPRYYVILNWWFFLQTEFPCLVRSFNKVRYILEQINDK